MGRPFGNSPPLRERFDDAYIPEPNTGCWLWTANAIPGGYGNLLDGRGPGTKTLAHRFSFERAHGPIPTGMQVCHRCDTRLCVNPDHLFLGTQLDNMRDMHRKGRAVRPVVETCRRGHLLSGRNLMMSSGCKSRGPQKVCRACRNRVVRENYHRKRAKHLSATR